MDSTDKYIGQLLDSRYEILEKIGSGGMAVVYKARCHRLNRLVAVKILKDELAGDADFRRRFRTESQAVAMLSHPNIVAVYDVSRSGNTEYIVMELIEGITLKQYINRKGLLNWKESLHFTTQVAKALSHAHSRGIIHRDIKPHNIMILKDGSVKVADFGIARLQSTQNTLTQEALGSVHYISPEQAKGSHVDARSDIYSLGVVMYEMLTSHLPFEGDSAVSIAIQHISAMPLLPRDINPDIPVGLESIAMHAMEPDLNARYTSADEMLLDLEEFRKNPDTRFEYIPNDAAVGPAVSPQATREVPSGAIMKADSVLPKPVRTPPKNTEMTRDEYRRSHRRASKTSTMIGIVGVVIFLVVVFAFMWQYILKGIVAPEEIWLDTPRFIGQKYDDILRNADYTADYEFTSTEEYNDTAEAGVVTAQSPQPDRSQRKPSSGKIAVSLTVSKGKEPAIQMPDLFNDDYRLATNELEKLMLDLDIRATGAPHDEITRDHIISTIPAAGDELVKGGTIYITYSTGPEEKRERVPAVEGLPLSAAILRLEGYNMTYDLMYEHHPDIPKDYVISQDLEAGTEVPIKTKVVLLVSSGPVEPSPEPSPSPSPEPSPPEESPSPSPEYPPPEDQFSLQG